MNQTSIKKRKRITESLSKTPAKTVKKRRTKKEPPVAPIEDTKFPFIKLPGEIRNMIYCYALTDTEYSIRFEANISKRDGRCIVNRLYRAVDGPPDRDDLPSQTNRSITKPSHSFKRTDTFRKPRAQTSFAIALFQVNRQINAEAAAYFYGGNMFVFEAVPHMFAFLTHFHWRIPLLRKLGLVNAWVPNPKTYHGPQMYLNTTQLSYVFPWLVNAPGLEELHLGPAVMYALATRGRIAARKLFEQGFCWMDVLGAKKGNRLAVLDVLKLPEVAAGYRWATMAAEHAMFRTELVGRLTAA